MVASAFTRNRWTLHLPKLSRKDGVTKDRKHARFALSARTFKRVDGRTNLDLYKADVL